MSMLAHEGVWEHSQVVDIPSESIVLEQSAGDTLGIDGTVDPSDIRQYMIEMDQSHHRRNVVRDSTKFNQS